MTISNKRTFDVFCIDVFVVKELTGVVIEVFIFGRVARVVMTDIECVAVMCTWVVSRESRHDSSDR